MTSTNDKEDELLWANFAKGPKLTKAQVRKASIKVGNLLVAMNIAQAKHDSIIVKVPKVLFEDVVDQPDDETALSMVFALVHDEQTHLVAEAISSIIVTDNITPVKTRQRRAAADLALEGLDDLSLGSSFITPHVPPLPQPKTGQKTAHKDPATSKPKPKPKPKAKRPVIEVIDESGTSEDTSDQDVAADDDDESEDDDDESSQTDDFDSPAIYLNPKRWPKCLMNVNSTPTLLCSRIKSFYQTVHDKHPYDGSFLLDVIYSLAKAMKQLPKHSPGERDLVCAASRIIARYEFFNAKLAEGGDAKSAAILENCILDISLPMHLREARRTALKKATSRKGK
jgi:hypothetical protein